MVNNFLIEKIDELIREVGNLRVVPINDSYIWDVDDLVDELNDIQEEAHKANKIKGYNYDYVINQLINHPEKVFYNIRYGSRIEVVDGKITREDPSQPIDVSSEWVELGASQRPITK